MIPYLLVGLAAAVLTFVSTPSVRWLALKLNVIDHPSDRKVHALPTPTLGGLALFVGLFGGCVVAWMVPELGFGDVFVRSSQILGVAAGGLVIFALGVVDDMKPLPAPVKLAGQIFAAGILFLSGVKMRFLLLPAANVSLSEDVSVILTVVWIVAMINAVNLVDGLDGLAAGIVAIASASFFVYTYSLENSDVVGFAFPAPLLATVITGASLGFLRHNFHPARIFMGDSGSMLLGLALGATTIIGVGNLPPGETLPTSNVFLAYFPLLIPLMVLAIPLLDAMLAIVRRARRRRNVFHADKEHIHHRLMDLGHGHRQAVIVMYIWSALASGAALAFTFLDRSNVIFALPVAVGAIVLYTLFPVLTKAIQERL